TARTQDRTEDTGRVEGTDREGRLINHEPWKLSTKNGIDSFFGHAYAYVMGLPFMHNQAGFREWSALIDDIWLSDPGGLGF
ncbi:MAG TPA: hypothetical protein VKA63_03255, partial [Candidatus Krumholzibacteria bacterium]|nr:hypothetical protein [Candidatus Krumholzibacteria bacterium]